jgi:hypothetical protein
LFGNSPLRIEMLYRPFHAALAELLIGAKRNSSNVAQRRASAEA